MLNPLQAARPSQPRRLGRRLVPIGVGVVALAFASPAFGHARLSPPVSLAKESQLYSLVVPTEKEGQTTTKVTLTVPKGFSIDSFVPAPGWTRQVQQTGSGDSAVIQQVTWTGGKVPTEEDALFQFLAQPASTGRYTFQVRQSYSDGSIVNWSGSESSEDPAPTIEAKSSLGGGGSSTLAIVAIVVGAVAVVLATLSLIARSGKRQLA
jgi:uncharacterized protein YcnI